MNNKHRIVKFTVAILFATLASGTFAASNISVIYGNKSVEKSDWDPIDSLTEYGLGFEYQAPDIPAAIVLNYFSSGDSVTESGIKYTGKTTEFGIGVRKYFPLSRLRFFVEGGVARISVDVKTTITASDFDADVGWWLGAGINFMVLDDLSVGFLARKSEAKVTVNNFTGEVGGTHLGVFAAYHFDY